VETKSKVALVKGGRWECKGLIKKAIDFLGGMESFVKKGDKVLLKPNLGYPEPPGMPAWTCTTDYMVLVALTEICFEAGASQVIVGEGCAHGIKASYMFENTGIKAAIEKVGGTFSCFDEESTIEKEIPGGRVLRKQAIPKIVTEVDVIINVPKIKPTRVGRNTLGFKNLFGFVPDEERVRWHRIPEHFYFVVDLMKLIKPTLTVMDGLVIQEGYGPRFGDIVDLGVIVVGKDPVATEAVTVAVTGHECYEQEVLPIAEKQGLGTADFNKIEVIGETIDSVRRFCKRSPMPWMHSSPNVVEYAGGACWGCGLWIQYTPHPWEIAEEKKYALVVGNMPEIPEKFTEDEVWIMGNCAIRYREKIEKACPENVKVCIIPGCPPYGHRRPGYLKAHQIDHLPHIREHDE
jgi:uncharacterized protein (DUF362 family)